MRSDETSSSLCFFQVELTKISQTKDSFKFLQLTINGCPLWARPCPQGRGLHMAGSTLPFVPTRTQAPVCPESRARARAVPCLAEEDRAGQVSAASGQGAEEEAGLFSEGREEDERGDSGARRGGRGLASRSQRRWCLAAESAQVPSSSTRCVFSPVLLCAVARPAALSLACPAHTMPGLSLGSPGHSSSSVASISWASGPWSLNCKPHLWMTVLSQGPSKAWW